ncbi:MAG: YdcF family protein [Alphaproteobacteria bacterium]|nr:YdcF family protein [Alphaproteobacteria bacterium]
MPITCSSFYRASLLLLLAGVAAVWLSGLFHFTAQIRAFGEPVIDASLPATEAIVVLTGGSERLTTGLELLAAGKGRKLLISGVPANLTLDHILAKHPVAKDLRDCCIILGHAADNTVGNAEETYAWMKTEGFHSLRLVTAHYHMPRSLLVFGKMLPDVLIITHPVAPESVKLDAWWLHPGTASLLIMEYNKYLFAAGRDWVESQE